MAEFLDEAALARIRAVAWLRARDVTEAWVAERFAAHLAAIAPFVKEPLPAVRVEIVDTAAAACATARPLEPLATSVLWWSEAAGAATWHLASGARTLDPDRRAALDAACRRTAGATAYEDGYSAMESVCTNALQPIAWPPTPFAKSATPDDPVRWIQQRGVAAFASDAKWRFMFDTPSPFGPIFELWEAGLWPFPTSDGRLVAWRPSVSPDGTVEELPTLGFMQRDSPEDASTRALRELAINLGLADVPGMFIYPPVGNPPGPF